MNIIKIKVTQPIIYVYIVRYVLLGKAYTKEFQYNQLAEACLFADEFNSVVEVKIITITT